MNRVGTAPIVAFATEYEEQAGDELVIPTDLNELSADELVELVTKATEAFDALYGDGTARLTDEQFDTLAGLTEGIEALNAEIALRESAAAERAEQVAALAARVRPVSEDTEAGDEPEGESGETPEGETEEEPEGETEEEPEGESTDEVEAVAASAREPLRIPMSAIRRNTPAPAEEAGDDNRAVMFAAAGVSGLENGAAVSFDDLGKALSHRLSGHNAATYRQANASGRALREQHSLAVIRRDFDDRLVVENNDSNHVDEVMSYAANESRLEGNSLVAAGGWCAPSETVYDFLEVESRDGLFSLPEFNVTRGGINFTSGPSFASIYTNIEGFSYTEAEDIDGDYDGEGGGSKPCYTLECPDFTDVRLQLDGLCIQAGLLQRRSFPEYQARVVRGALTAHAHRMSARQISAVEAGSTAITIPANQAGAAAPILSGIELHVEHYRSSHRLPVGTSLEAIVPTWVRAAMRADLARRQGVDLVDVPNERVDAWFAQRGVNPQYVYNWQGLDATAVASLTAFPTSVKVLLYQAGTWTRGVSDVITIDSLYDSTLLSKNDFTALFTEEGWLVAKRGHDSRALTIPICANGATNYGQIIACDGVGTDPQIEVNVEG